MKDGAFRKSILKIIPGVLSFALPVIVVAVGYLGVGIYPGSKTLLLTYDLKAQLLPIYGYVSHGGPGFDNLIHSMSGGLGGDFFGSIALYLSPFDLIYCLVPLKYFPDAIYFMNLFKIGLCGVFCCAFLQNNGKIRPGNVYAVCLSSCYALMSYNFMYSMSPMWYDEVMLLPLLALSLEKVINGKKSLGFIFLCAFGIISDYYIAYMSIIALVLYFFFRLSEEGLDIRSAASRLGDFVVHGLFSAGISLFILVPVVLDLGKGKVSEGLFASGAFLKNTFPDVVKSFTPQHYTGLGYNASPCIFCGSLVVFLAIVWLISFKKNIMAHVAGLIIILFYFVSFMFGPFDRFWHGFRDPNNFSVRYAYTFSFFLIVFSVRGIECIKDSRIKISASLSKLLVTIVIAYTFLELYANGSYILASIGTESGYTLRDEYDKYCEVAENLIPYEKMSDASGYGRVLTTYNFSSFDGALYGYDGLARFSSSYNFNISEMFRSLGVASIYQNLKDKGVTPPVAGLINGRYYLTFMMDLSDYFQPVDEYRGYILYENKNVLPLAFEISSNTGNAEAFEENPFENINIVYSELFKENNDSSGIFVKQQYIDTTDSIYSLNGCNSYENIEFTTENTGHYFLFVRYLTDEYGPEDTYLPMPLLRSLYVDGMYYGEYGTSQYSYCIDLGDFSEGESHTLTFLSSGMKVGDVLLYSYNDATYKQIADNANGFELTYIGNRGIRLSGTVSDDSRILFSLPAEPGYKVTVDGQKTDFTSYRNTLMTIPVSSGSHEITVTYFPPGLRLGILLSVLSLIIFCLYVRKKKESDSTI